MTTKNFIQQRGDMFTNIIRLSTLLCIAYCMIAMPIASWTRSYADPWSLVPMILGVECLLVSGALRLIDRWGQPIQWFSTPLILVGCLLLARGSELGILSKRYSARNKNLRKMKQTKL